MRSKLFLPASRPELYAKALASDADALSFDLEDAVKPEHKAAAQEALGAWLATDAARNTDKRLIVRVNALTTPHFDADLAACVQASVALINLPKPSSPAEVRAAAARIEQLERQRGLTNRVGLLINIESPYALRNAYQLASAHPRVAGLQLGLGDLFEPTNIDRRLNTAVEQALFAVKMAASEAGVFAYDSAFANIADEAGFVEEAKLSHRMGFLGKSCIHPKQIALANAVFRPTDAAIAHSLNVVAAAKTHPNGAFTVDGKMIDPPFIVRAEAILAQAKQLGLLT